MIRHARDGTSLLVLSVSLLALTACTMGVTPRSATYYTDGGLWGLATFGDVAQQAQEHCEQFGRDAEHVADDSLDTATFRCVDR